MLKAVTRSRCLRALAVVAAAWLAAGPARADSFLSWYAKAEKAALRKDDGAALQAWSNALYLCTRSDGKAKKARALSARAALHERRGDWPAALDDLAAALPLDSKNAALYYRRGHLRLEHGLIADSIGDFYKATSLKLNYAEAFFDRGRAYESQGDALFAREDYQSACRLGLTKACGQNSTAKPPETKKVAPPKPAATAAPKPPPAVPKAAPAAAPAAPVDMRACIGRLSACADNGGSYGTCVARAALCEADPKRGCCPKKCVDLFQKLADAKSEASAFREAFTPKNACAGN